MKKSINENEQCVQTDVKCRFFVQYWGQNIGNYAGRNDCQINMNTINHLNFITLKQLSEISNEDAIKIAEIFGIEEDYLFVGKFLCNGIFDNSADCEENTLFNSNVKAVDYLRSKGYAVPFMQYSVEDLISFGWVRLV